MPPRSFLENLRNAPADFMKEIKRVASPEKPPAAAHAAGKAERLAIIQQRADQDRVDSAKKAQEIRNRFFPPVPPPTRENVVSMREMDEFMRGPSPSERGAVYRDSGPSYVAPTVEQARRADAIRTANASFAGLRPGSEAYAASLAALDRARGRKDLGRQDSAQ